MKIIIDTPEKKQIVFKTTDETCPASPIIKMIIDGETYTLNGYEMILMARALTQITIV